MNKNLFLIFAGIILLTSFISATNVAYVVRYGSNSGDEVFIDVIEEMGLSYEIIDQTEFSTTNFGEYDFILVGNENFLSPEDIPINEYPSLIVNGQNIDDWNWAQSSTKSKQNSPFTATVVAINTITNGIFGEFFAYDSGNADIYYLDNTHIFDGLEIVVARDNNGHSDNGIVVVAHKGTTLTHWSSAPVNINADGVFMGMTDTEYWTNDTRQIFKNSIAWLSEDRSVNSEISLENGVNLISFPLELKDSDVSSLGPGISWVKRFNGSEFVETSTIMSGEAYLVNSTGGPLTINGFEGGSQSKILKEGMNFVGISSLNNVLISTLPSEVIEISKINNDGSFTTSTKYFGLWYNSFSLEPGKAYWIKTKSEAVWNY